MISSLLLIASLALAPAGLYNQGNKYYAQKDYPNAIQSYQQALQGGAEPQVLYNLGNAYFKAGQLGRAVICYGRARFLTPRDQDISTNLTFARSYRVDKNLFIAAPMARFFSLCFHYFSLTEAALLAALLFVLGAAAISAYIVYRKIFLTYVAGLAWLLFLPFFITQQVWQGEKNSNPAVIVAAEVNTLSGPGQDYKQILLLHDGTEVNIREQRGEYLLIQLPGGAGGWVKKDAVEKIF